MRIRRILGKFWRFDAGVAAVEFAMVMPIMLLVYFGCSEAAALLTADRKVQSVAGAVGDLVARANKTLPRAQLEDYFEAASSIMAPYDVSGLVQTVTAVAVSADGEATVTWSRRFENGVLSDVVAEHPQNAPFDLPEEMIAIATGQTVIAAETSYNYRPLLGAVFKNELDLRRSALFMPRFGGTITLN
jgi:Flp pilus assembly protein TadG